MGLVLGLAAVIWGAGYMAGLSRGRRFVLIGWLLAVVILSHFVLPDGHPIRETTGGDVMPWLILVSVAILVWGYLLILNRLKTAVEAQKTKADPMDRPLFSDTELERYARHIMLREIGGPGQKALKEAKVLVIGAGGLGAPALSYLGAMGVGTIGIIDDDTVENSNLQRQVPQML